MGYERGVGFLCICKDLVLKEMLEGLGVCVFEELVVFELEVGVYGGGYYYYGDDYYYNLLVLILLC